MVICRYNNKSFEPLGIAYLPLNEDRPTDQERVWEPTDGDVWGVTYYNIYSFELIWAELLLNVYLFFDLDDASKHNI